MFAKEILFFLILLPLFADAIIGGEYVTNPHQYPWMVYIAAYDMENEQSALCGGAIISENIILTAAHCVVERRWSQIDVAIGHSTLNQSIWVKVESKLIHPNYLEYDITQYEEGVFDLFENTALVSNADIALLKLSENLKFNKAIQPIALPDEDFNETNERYLNPNYHLSKDVYDENDDLNQSSTLHLIDECLPKFTGFRHNF